MRTYPVDTRRKIVEAVWTGTPREQVTRTLGLGLSTVSRYAGRAERGESLTPRKPLGKERKAGRIEERLLERHLEERPSATLLERREIAAGARGRG